MEVKQIRKSIAAARTIYMKVEWNMRGLTNYYIAAEIVRWGELHVNIKFVEIDAWRNGCKLK